MRQALTILVAEDDRNDALLLKLAFGQAGVDVWPQFVSDGKEAIDYLRGEPPFNDRVQNPWPDLLVLDLKMPRTTGFEVLEWLRQRPDLKPLGVLVLSGSHWQADIDRAYALGANFYCTKPLDFRQLVGVAESLKEKGSSAPLADKMKSRICICCGQPIAEVAQVSLGNQNLCASCSDMAAGLPESANASADIVFPRANWLPTPRK